LSTVSLNNYALFKKNNYTVKVENCNFIVLHSNYFQRSSPVFAMQAFVTFAPSQVYYTGEHLFSPSAAMKSRPAYYTGVCGIAYARFYCISGYQC